MAASTQSAAGPTVRSERGALLALGAIVIAVLCVAASAEAQTGGALRVGVGARPSQLWAGGHLQVDPARFVRLRMDVEGGIGTEVSIGGNALVALVAPVGSRPWSLYVGAGSTAVLASGDGTSGRHTGGGGLAVLGFSHRQGFFGEVLVPFGGADQPSARVMVGYVFAR